jgi:hypothetical protein
MRDVDLEIEGGERVVRRVEFGVWPVVGIWLECQVSRKE